jgi:ABC-2 type transport system ATP-binding protein
MSEHADDAIEVRSLRMAYGEHEVLDGLDLDVRRGEIYAVLGPNGAGKTTTLEILEGFRRRGGGHVRVLGEDPEHAGPTWRERIGIVLQASTPEAELTVEETLRLYAGFYARPAPVARLLELCGLSDQAGVRNKRLSGGQQRRLDVALALAGNPELLFLDEPTTGFDPAARRSAWAMIAGLRSLGTTIVLTTHYLEEAEVLADRIAVVHHGRIVAEGTPADLGGRDRAETVIAFHLPAGVPPWPGATQTQTPSPSPSASGGVRYVVATRDVTLTLYELTRWAVERGVELGDVEVSRPSLEDIYFGLTSGPTKEAVTA